MDEKFCPGCGETLPVTSFQKNRAAPDGLQYHCKLCRKSRDARPEKRKQDRERYHNNKPGYLDSYYKRVYGISYNDYQRILKEQNGVCAICMSKCITGKSLAVDHDHETGAVRGLLCTKCNSGLGQFEDNTVRLYTAIAYLEKRYQT